MQNKYEGKDYHLTNNKGALWVQNSVVICVSLWGIFRGFPRRFPSKHQRRKEGTFRSLMLKLHAPLSTLTVIIKISETLRAVAKGQVSGGLWGMLPSDAQDLCPVQLLHGSEPAASWCVSWRWTKVPKRGGNWPLRCPQAAGWTFWNCQKVSLWVQLLPSWPFRYRGKCLVPPLWVHNGLVLQVGHPFLLCSWLWGNHSCVPIFYMRWQIHPESTSRLGWDSAWVTFLVDVTKYSTKGELKGARKTWAKTISWSREMQSMVEEVAVAASWTVSSVVRKSGEEIGCSSGLPPFNSVHAYNPGNGATQVRYVFLF